MMQALSSSETKRVTECVQRAWFGSAERDRISLAGSSELVIEHTDDDALRFGIVMSEGGRVERLRDMNDDTAQIPEDIQHIVEDVLSYDARLTFYRVPTPVDKPTVYRATLQLPSDANVVTTV